MIARSIVFAVFAVAIHAAVAITGSGLGVSSAVAQDVLISAGKSPDAVLREVQAKGVKAVSESRLRAQIGSFKGSGGSSEYDCGTAACMCIGASDCLDLIDSGKCKSGFHCLPTNEGPSCVCEQ